MIWLLAIAFNVSGWLVLASVTRAELDQHWRDDDMAERALRDALDARERARKEERR